MSVRGYAESEASNRVSARRLSCTLIRPLRNLISSTDSGSRTLFLEHTGKTVSEMTDYRLKRTDEGPHTQTDQTHYPTLTLFSSPIGHYHAQSSPVPTQPAKRKAAKKARDSLQDPIFSTPLSPSSCHRRHPVCSLHLRFAPSILANRTMRTSTVESLTS